LIGQFCRVLLWCGTQCAFFAGMDNQTTILSKVMDLAAARHAVLANNLANVNTPGFRRRDLEFKEALTKAVENHDVREIRQLEPEVVDDETQPVRPDGNNVSSHTEMTAMTQNELLFQVSARFLTTKYQWLKSAMK